ncbi:MAG: MBL fold metallo-hydrolase [Candidatus Heimdallarchaeaceae archaeon]|jgi:glyoxylase-like metal-dependent hydrolase (beta-lactamase superfamily II)
MEEYIKLDLFFTEVYLLKTSDGYIQFEAGMKQNLKKYLKMLDKHKIDPEEIKLIVVGHAHFDHVSALKKMKELTKAQILVHENDAEYLRKGTSSEVKTLHLSSKLLMSFVPKSWIVYDPVEPDIVIKDEYSLQEFGIDAKIIHTPGHTAGTVSLITKKGNAFIGCCAHGVPLRLIPGLPKIAQDIDQVISSWEKIIKEGAKTLHISHGKALTVEKMKKILKKKRGVS